MNDILDRILFEKDGIYFLVDYEKKNPKEDIFYIIDKYKIKDINYLQIEGSIVNKEKQVFLTKDKDAIDINERMDIFISEDKLKAEVIFIPPQKDGKLLKSEDIFYKISNLNIKFGLNLSSIEDFIQKRDYDKTYVIANGLPPEKSKDGYLQYFVDIKEKKIKPKILDDGSIDYKTLDLFENVRAGNILVSKVYPIKGKNGTDIYGEVVESDKPLEAPLLPKGKNTEISTDGKNLLSTINGCIFYRNKLVDVLPILEIKSNVDNSTGNIDFMGSVIVRGNVLTGFNVKAEGNVTVYGWVEGATIVSQGNIIILKGVQGSGKAKLISSESINLNFVENTTIIAEKDINANYIMHCNIFSNGNVSVIGKRGLILGGKSVIGGNLLAKYIGSEMSYNTDITVGINYKILNKYEELIKILDIMNNRYNELEKIVEKLSKVDINYLSEDKRILFEKAIKEKLSIKKKLVICKSEIQKITPLFTKNKSKIEVTNKLYSGSKICINNAIIFIKEDIAKCVLKNIDGKIQVFK